MCVSLCVYKYTTKLRKKLTHSNVLGVFFTRIKKGEFTP